MSLSPPRATPSRLSCSHSRACAPPARRSPGASSSSTAEPRKPVVWEDLTTGKFHAVNNETGEHVECDRNGRPIAQFHHGISGVASTKERLGLRLKDVALQKSLLLPEQRRPRLARDEQRKNRSPAQSNIMYH